MNSNIKNDVKVSVVIPIYNVEAYLPDCLDSVLAQTLKELEIICINDGSCDNSLKVIQEYALKDERVILVNLEKKQGVAVARNAGIKVARGEYIYFLDSDDTITKDAMENLYVKASQENLDVICFEGTTVFETEELKKRFGWHQKWCIRSKEYNGVKSGKQLMVDMYDNDDYKALVWILFIKREFYEREQLGFAEGLVAYSDNLFTYECMLKAPKACHLFESYYVRKVRDGSITSTKRKTIKYPYGFFYCAKKMASIASHLEMNVREREIVNKEICRMLNSAIDEIRKLDEKEVVKYKDFPADERVAFEQLVVQPFLLKKELKSLRHFRWLVKIGRAIAWLPRKIMGKK